MFLRLKAKCILSFLIFSKLFFFIILSSSVARIDMYTISTPAQNKTRHVPSKCFLNTVTKIMPVRTKKILNCLQKWKRSKIRIEYFNLMMERMETRESNFYIKELNFFSLCFFFFLFQIMKETFNARGNIVKYRTLRGLKLKTPHLWITLYSIIEKRERPSCVIR